MLPALVRPVTDPAVCARLAILVPIERYVGANYVPSYFEGGGVYFVAVTIQQPETGNWTIGLEYVNVIDSSFNDIRGYAW